MSRNTTYYMQTSTGEVFTTTTPEYHKDCKQIPKSEGAELYREHVKSNLLKKIKPGQTIYCVIRKVSASGMSRNISLFIVEKGALKDITYSASVVMGDTWADDGSIRVTGCGMDMCFHTVYQLGRYLWPKGTRKPHGTRNGVPDSDGGYALRHSTI